MGEQSENIEIQEKHNKCLKSHDLAKQLFELPNVVVSVPEILDLTRSVGFVPLSKIKLSEIEYDADIREQIITIS